MSINTYLHKDGKVYELKTYDAFNKWIEKVEKFFGKKKPEEHVPFPFDLEEEGVKILEGMQDFEKFMTLHAMVGKLLLCYKDRANNTPIGYHF